MPLSRRLFLSAGLGAAGSVVLASSTPRWLSAVAAESVQDATALDFASALEVARAIRRHTVSAVEVLRRLLERIERHNPKLNAIVSLAAEEALARARAADQAAARGEWWGPLHGVPCTIKDTFETRGLRTTAGAPDYANYIPTRDAVVVARLRAAGAIVLGKTNVPLMAGDWQSYNEIFGTTNNPWNPGRTPGGSSGGSAAALAAGLSYLEVGSDIGGSIRVPAHFCGVYGHKPTLNIVPMRGHIPPPPGGPPSPPFDLPVAGPLARSAADLKLALETLAGPDTEDALAYRWTLRPARGSRLADYRIGYVMDHPLAPPSADIRHVLATTLDKLREAGAQLEEGWPAGVAPEKQFETYEFLLWSFFAYELRDAELEEIRALAARRDGSFKAKQAWAWTAPHKHYLDAREQRMAARAAWQEYFRTHDAFLLPTAVVAAFPHDHSQPMDSRVLQTPEGPRPYLDNLFWISFATLTGLPATTAPAGLTREGLPVGIQIVGPYLEDATPIDLAGLFSDVVGGFKPPAGY